MKLNALRLTAALIIFICLYQTVSLFCLSSFNKVIIDHSIETATQLHIYFNGGKNNFRFTEKFSSDTEKTIQTKEGYRSTLHLNNKIIQTLRIDPGNIPGRYQINQIVLYSYFGPPLTITPGDHRYNLSSDPSSQLETTQEAWTLVSSGEDPYLVISGPLKTNNILLNLLPAVAGTCILLILANRFDFSSTKLYHDIFAKKPSSGKNYIALDGIRGFAALLVLADHTGLPGFDNMAPIGVVIFFCLSGFLLTMPFTKDPSKASSLDYMQSYLIRRIKRIAPMFYFIAFAGYYFQGNLPDFIRAILFVEGRGIKWTVLQEIYFYAILPIIAFLCYAIFKGKPLRCFSALLILSIVLNTGLIPTGYIYGLGEKIPLYFGVFITGMSMCYLLHSSFATNTSLKRILTHPISGCLLLMMLFFHKNLIHSFHHISGYIPGSLYQSNFDIIIGIILLVAAMESKGVIYRFFSFKPFRIIGIIGYSFYLLHPVVHIVNKIVFQQYIGVTPPPIFYFISALIFTSLLAAVTYTYIERPFIRK